MRIFAVALMALALAACGGDKSQARLPSQQWGDINITVEFRPVPLRQGMNEFMVIATHPDRTAAKDLVVSLRSNPDAQWQQAIQDGNIGVYRRAVRLEAGDQTLYVHLRQRLEEQVLEFPVSVAQ